MRTSAHDNTIFQVRAENMNELAQSSGEEGVSVRYIAKRYACASRSELGAAERIV